MTYNDGKRNWYAGMIHVFNGEFGIFGCWRISKIYEKADGSIHMNLATCV